MRIGYQGETHSYSDRAAEELFPGHRRVGFPTFVAAFEALRAGRIDRLVLPIENSTTGSVLPVLDRLLPGNAHIVAEHLVEVRHCLLGLPGADLGSIERVRSHPEALAQAEATIAARGWTPVPAGDTAGAVREVAEKGDPTEAALAPEAAAEPYGLEVLARNVMDREHNTTRFVVVAAGPQPIDPQADKTSIAFTTKHQPGALALALTELGLRGANLTRIESRPAEEAWRYRFFVDLRHPPGPEGLSSVFEPPLATLSDLRFLGTYRAAS
ncbi:MAG: prephenate dehydratase [Acidimicrobiia bacterium]|nr:MAG: prephenate dehydratase [Acidimicrobiia bacterium]